ncbi:YqgE/AlgH family protein [Mobilicoccus massiliensis]|uniref:YqgE/AlgH family protein n=1 Tax=Mobilicoccus massiliensis TaxID=1522310 RepID=UPI00058F000B|nr:YqgE/AlgH family protein [Mobilicoccus massiliensis]
MGDVTYLAGRLLVATPGTGGDIFHRSVVLLLHHDDDGAHGLVLNKPIEADVEAVLPTWQEHVVAPGHLFQGGPVGLDTALGLVRLGHGGAEDDLGIKRLFGEIGVVDLDAPPEIVMPHVSSVRVFAGYSGWGAGQLEGELEAGAWYVVDARPGDPFMPVPEILWRLVLRRSGGKIAWLANYPEDPQMN